MSRSPAESQQLTPTQIKKSPEKPTGIPSATPNNTTPVSATTPATNEGTKFNPIYVPEANRANNANSKYNNYRHQNGGKWKKKFKEKQQQKQGINTTVPSKVDADLPPSKRQRLAPPTTNTRIYPHHSHNQQRNIPKSEPSELKRSHLNLENFPFGLSRYTTKQEEEISLPNMAPFTLPISAPPTPLNNYISQSNMPLNTPVQQLNGVDFSKYSPPNFPQNGSHYTPQIQSNYPHPYQPSTPITSGTYYHNTYDPHTRQYDNHNFDTNGALQSNLTYYQGISNGRHLNVQTSEHHVSSDSMRLHNSVNSSYTYSVNNNNNLSYNYNKLIQQFPTHNAGDNVSDNSSETSTSSDLHYPVFKQNRNKHKNKQDKQKSNSDTTSALRSVYHMWLSSYLFIFD